MLYFWEAKGDFVLVSWWLYHVVDVKIILGATERTKNLFVETPRE